MLAVLSLLPAAALAFAQPPANSDPPTTPSGKPLAFSIISIRPRANTPSGSQGCTVDACHFINVSLSDLIDAVYNISNKLVFGGPSWASEDRFDVDAKIDPADLPTPPPTRLQLINMLQPVLVDRFQLRVHHETRTLPAYDLVLAKAGSKLKESAPPAPGAAVGPCQVASHGEGSFSLHNCGMDAIAHALWAPSGRTVIDKTGLTGRYDCEIRWTPDNAPADSAIPDSSAPSIFTAVQEQLGLKLEPSTASLDVLVIDSAQKPSAN